MRRAVFRDKKKADECFVLKSVERRAAFFADQVCQILIEQWFRVEKTAFFPQGNAAQKETQKAVGRTALLDLKD